MSTKTIPERGESRVWVSNGAKKNVRRKGLLTCAGEKCSLDNVFRRTVRKVKNDQEDDLNRVNESALHDYPRHSD
jgi:hypothetical protein